MLRLDDVTFGYKTERVIENLGYEFDEGAVTVITGPSGRGKSTLLFLLGLLVRPWAGRISFRGEDMTDWSDLVRSRFRARRVGFVFQDAALDQTRTVRDNIIEPAIYGKLPRREALRRAEELMDRFGVALRSDHRPGEISGGQAQRIALCRALINRPDVVLADEPTGNLDTDTARIVVDALHDLAHDRDRTVVIATHDPEIVASADRVLRL